MALSTFPDRGWLHSYKNGPLLCIAVTTHIGYLHYSGIPEVKALMGWLMGGGGEPRRRNTANNLLSEVKF